jgi:ATP-dependent Clp protease ATP-binding subunit ClpC
MRDPGDAMLERLTDPARHVLALAQEEARFHEHDFVGTEHLLLGLVLEAEGLATKALTALGIDVSAVQERLEQAMGTGGPGTAGPAPFTAQAKKVLELAGREALTLGHYYVGTGHLLLGLLGEGQGAAAQLLAAMGADLSGVRSQLRVQAGQLAERIVGAGGGARYATVATLPEVPIS